MELQELVEKIIYYSNCYYDDGSSPISDKEFDSLIDELKASYPNHPLLSKTGWGYKILDGVEHKYHEIKGIEKKFKSVKDTEAFLNPHWLWEVTPKLDGACVVCYYEKGMLSSCITRGDGLQGRDVTKNLVTRVPMQMKNGLTGYVRCEVLVSRWNFEHHFPPGRSLRNTATGLMGAKTPEPSLLQYLDVIPVSMYDAIEDKVYTPYFKEKWQSAMVNWKKQLPCVLIPGDKHPASCLVKDTIGKLIGERYLCDGLVVRIGGEPLRMFAFKFDDEVKTTYVTDVEWHTMDTGKIFPTVVYEPTELSGCVTTKSSGKSHDFVSKNGIGKGAVVSIVRSGEIIPNIVEVIVPATATPVKCEHGCDPEYLEIDGAHAYCRYPGCPATIFGMFKRLIMTFAPKGFYEDTLETIMKHYKNNIFTLLEELKQYEKKKVYTIDLGKLTEHRAKMIEETFRNIMKWRLTLEQLTDIGLVEYFGSTQCQLIESKATSEDELNTWCKNATTIIPDWSLNSRATANWTARHSVLKTLLSYFRLVLSRKRDRQEYKGVVCITGKIESMRKERFAELYIESQGYKWTQSIHEATILIDAEGRESSKVKVARKNKIKIIPISEWIKGESSGKT